MQIEKVTPSSTTQQAMELMQSLSEARQKSALDYIKFLVSQDDQFDTSLVKSNAHDSRSVSSQDAGKFSDIFGMIKTEKRVSLEDMDAVIRQRGAGL